ncbi:DUF305 domain-containing protein [Catenulispora yoronensis]
MTAVLVAVVVGLVVGAAGAWPLARSSSSSASSSASVPAGDSADAGFVRDMAIHHQQAVDMAFTIRDATDDEQVRRLAFDIINTQANQRGMMLGWLAAWQLPVYSPAEPMAWMGAAHSMAPGGALMPGMATDEQLTALRAAHGKDAEIQFLKLMIAHHKGGVQMAQAEAGLGKQPQVLRLAGTIVDGQLAEIRLMSDMLAQRGATA